MISYISHFQGRQSHLFGFSIPIHSFITEIYIAPLQGYYSEALPTLAPLKRRVLGGDRPGCPQRLRLCWAVFFNEELPMAIHMNSLCRWCPYHLHQLWSIQHNWLASTFHSLLPMKRTTEIPPKHVCQIQAQSALKRC